MCEKGVETMAAAQTLRRIQDVLPRGGALPEAAWESRHRGITLLAWLHVPVLAALSWFHTDLHAFTLVGLTLTSLLAAGGSGRELSQRVRSSSVTLSLLVSTALLIHLFHGLIEMHFHFFVVIAVVAMYQSWTPYLLALGFVVAHHGVMGLLMPMAVYNHSAAMAHPLGFSVLHGGFVLAESIACLAYWKSTEAAMDAERTQRRRAEDMGAHLATANQEISDLLAMMSHDLRAPVTVVNGYAAMALDSWKDFDDETHRQFVRKMGAAGRSLEEMLDDTLMMAAHDADGLHSRPVAVRVDEVVRAALSSLTSPLLQVDLTGLRSATALVDKGQLQQILTNLVTNASKYGCAPFALSTATDGDEVTIEVSDSGSGVPEEFVARLFDRYARSDEARRGSQKGSGLGLYIVRQLASSNGGEVSYQPREGGGSRFVVRLPRAPRLAMPVNRIPAETTDGLVADGTSQAAGS